MLNLFLAKFATSATSFRNVVDLTDMSPKYNVPLTQHRRCSFPKPGEPTASTVWVTPVRVLNCSFTAYCRSWGEHQHDANRCGEPARLIGESLQKNHKVEIRRGTIVEVEERLKRFLLDDRQPSQGYTISVVGTLAIGDRRFCGREPSCFKRYVEVAGRMSCASGC